MKRFFSLLLLLSATQFVRAQTQEDSVKLTVNTLFEAMRMSDSAMLKNTFTNDAILQTVNTKRDGTVAVLPEDIDRFASFVHAQPKGAADERNTIEVVKIDGPLAIVWSSYKLYFNGAFIHCGVNSFQLVKLNNEWKIQYLIDTRRKTGCE